MMGLCSLIIRKTSSNSKFVLPEDPETKELFKALIINIEDRYGSVAISRMVDIAVYIEYSNREERRKFIGLLTQIPQKYSTQSFSAYQERNVNMMYYEDEWLRIHGISRSCLCDSIKDESNIHTFSTTFEDNERKRFFNTKIGYLFCHMRTSGWDPTSNWCCRCEWSSECMNDLCRTYPLLFKQRNENI